MRRAPSCSGSSDPAGYPETDKKQIPGQLRSVDEAVGNLQQRGHIAGGPGFSGGPDRGGGGYGKDIFPSQQRRGLVEKKGAVHAAGEGHQRAAAAAEQLIEPLFFFPECGACKYIPEQGRLLPSLSVKIPLL